MPQFDWPWALAALALLPLLARHYRRRAARAPALRFTRGAGAMDMPRTLRQRWMHLPAALRMAALALLIVALAGPRLSGRRVREINRTTGVQLVVDCSGSMLARDLVFRGKPAARIDVVRELSRDFVFGDGQGLKGRPMDMIGVIAFAEEPVTLCPLTLTHESLRPVLDGVRVGSGADGTAIGDAVAVAAARFHQAETSAGQKFKSREIILLTDGDNNSGTHTVGDAARLAAEWGVRVYAIGIQPGSSKEDRGKSQGMVALDGLAAATGGKAHLVGDGEALRAVYEDIDRLEKSDVATVKFTGGRELMDALVLVAMGLLVTEVVLGQTWLRRLP
jgi:Ca-activated chloride channel family protein